MICKDHFINSHKALAPIDGLCKCWPRASPAYLNLFVLSHRHTPHSPLTGKFCLSFFCYLCCYIQAKINLCICLAHTSSEWMILENRDKSMEQHLWVKFSHIHHKVKKHWRGVQFVSSIFHVFYSVHSFLPAQTFCFSHRVPTWQCTQMPLPKGTAFSLSWTTRGEIELILLWFSTITISKWQGRCSFATF